MFLELGAVGQFVWLLSTLGGIEGLGLFNAPVSQCLPIGPKAAAGEDGCFSPLLFNIHTDDRILKSLSA